MKKLAAFAAAASLLVAVPAFAADKPRSVNEKVDRVFARLDADHDGRISRAEAEQGKRFANHFDRIDADRDGFVTRAELAAMIEKRMERRAKGR